MFKNDFLLRIDNLKIKNLNYFFLIKKFEPKFWIKGFLKSLLIHYINPKKTKLI